MSRLSYVKIENTEYKFWVTYYLMTIKLTIFQTTDNSTFSFMNSSAPPFMNNYIIKLSSWSIDQKNSARSTCGRIRYKVLGIFTYFEVNTKYLSWSVLKTSEFSRVRSMSENSDDINSPDQIYLVFTKKKEIFYLFYTFYRLHALSHPQKWRY